MSIYTCRVGQKKHIPAQTLCHHKNIMLNFKKIINSSVRFFCRRATGIIKRLKKRERRGVRRESMQMKNEE